VGKVFETCAFIKLRRSYAVVGYRTESHQVNTHLPSQQKHPLSSQLLLPSSSSFLTNCCKNNFLGEHSDGCFLVCFLLQCLLVVLFFCLIFSFFYLTFCKFCLLLFFFFFFKCCVVQKNGRAGKNSGQGDKRVLCHQIFVLVYKAQRFEPQILLDLFYNFIHISFLMKISL